MVDVSFSGADSRLSAAGYTIEEEGKVYEEVLEDIQLNTRWYLDNLPYLREFRVSWKTYRNKIPTLPLKYVKKDNAL
jgi:hypothetical protein